MYTVTYNVTDSEGNAADQVTRTVYVVIDKDKDPEAIVDLVATLSPSEFKRTGTIEEGEAVLTNGNVNDPKLLVSLRNNLGVETFIGPSLYEVTGLDTTSVTTTPKTLTVTHKNDNTLSDDANYTVVRNDWDKEINSLTAVLPKDTYMYGEAMGNLVVTRIDNDGTQTTINIDNAATVEVDGYVFTTPFNSTGEGSKSITVSYEGKSASDTYTVSGYVDTTITQNNFTGNDKPETGDTISYTVGLVNPGVAINVFPTYTISVTDGTVNCPTGATNCTATSFDWTPTSITDTLTYEVVVNDNVKAGATVTTTATTGTETSSKLTTIEEMYEVIVNETNPTTVDVVLTLDVSGSMFPTVCVGDYDYYGCEKYPDKIGQLIEVTKQFVTDLYNKNTNGSTIYVTIVTFGKSSNVSTLLNRTALNNETTLNSIKTTIDTLDNVEGGGTPLYTAVEKTTELLNSTNSAYEYAIILGDGDSSSEWYSKNGREKAIRNLHATGATIYTVGFDIGNVDALKNIANYSTKGTYIPASSSGTLDDAFTQIQASITPPVTTQTTSGKTTYELAGVTGMKLTYWDGTKTVTDNINLSALPTYITKTGNKYVWDLTGYEGIYTDFKMYLYTN